MLILYEQAKRIQDVALLLARVYSYVVNDWHKKRLIICVISGFRRKVAEN
jgi:hypothetical protein